MKKKILSALLLLCILFVSKASAQVVMNSDSMVINGRQNSLALEKNVKVVYKDILLSSQEAKYLKREHIIILKGKVKLKKQDILLDCDNLDADLQPLIFTAAGKVIVNFENIKTQSDQAQYSVNDEKIVLAGNIKAWQGKDEIKGNTITINLKDKKIKAEGRTRLQISPERL